MSDEQPTVYKVIGAPGTGKTTRVVGNPELPDVKSLVMENLEEGYTLQEQMIVTYTNAGVDEAADRLEKILNAPRYKIDERVTTIHAQSFRTIKSDEDVVQWYNKQEFCGNVGMEYGSGDQQDDLMAADTAEGNAFFDIYNWLKSNRLDIEDWEECPAEFPSNRDFANVAAKWEQYKRKNNLVDFADMIERAVREGKQLLHESGIPYIFKDNPESAMETFKEARHSDRFDKEKWRGRGPFVDTKVLYVDEVQDLTPLQWAWYLMQKLVCEKVYIGGDDDQTIYGWAGANPEFMLDEEGDFEVLDKTYRIPAEIWEVCDGVIRQVDVRQEKDVEPHGDGGEFITMYRPTPRRVAKHLEEGECMVLFRARYMIDKFREYLHAFGIPYDNMSTFDTWSDDIVTLRDALAKIKREEEQLTHDEVEVLKDYAYEECERCHGDGCQACNYDGETPMIDSDNGITAKESALGSLGGISVERVKETIDLSHRYKSERLTPGNFCERSSKVNYYEKEAITGNIQQNNEDIYPDRLRIGTIHSAKGKEAETVVVATDSTSQILEQMIEDTRDRPDKQMNDAERRVYYVGMTRASEKLVLADGVINPKASIPISHLLAEEEEEEEDQWAVDLEPSPDGVE